MGKRVNKTSRTFFAYTQSLVACLCKESCLKGLCLYKGLYASSLLVWLLFYSTSAYALGVGAAVSSSYIGQALSVRIPLFNVEDPNSLSVKLTQNDLPTNASQQMQAAIDRSNSQLAIRISSLGVVNEPYLSFTLELIDNGNAVTKDFVVLLDLLPSSALARQGVDNTPSVNAPQFTNTDAANVGLVSIANSAGSVMGPYEWAQQGQVANTFGAVLDGQSLWRVARRINKALGVSINQMMWGLYQANPQAFAGKSIDTLQAGSFLTIPSAAIVSQLSDAQAKRQLDSLSGQAVNQLPVTPQTTVEPELTRLATSAESQDAEPVSSSVSTGELADNAQPVAPFQLTNLDQAASVNGSGQLGGDAKSQEIIGSLVETVGNLTQELIRKDKKIAFLEEKVAALKGLDQVDNVALLEADTPVQSAGPTLDAAASTITNTTANTTANKAPSGLPRWLVIMLWVAAIVGVLSFIFRQRLAALIESLNLFGSGRDLEFEKSRLEVSPAEPKLKSDREYADIENHSIMEVVKTQMQSSSAGVPYLDFVNTPKPDQSKQNSDESDEDGYDEQDSELVFLDGADIDYEPSFVEQFEQMLEDGDFGAARSKIDAARYKEIEDDYYHCARLQLYQMTNNEERFYEYYYQIEAKIPDFSPNVQIKISQMVVLLAQA